MVPSDQLAAATVYYLWVQAQINGRWISAASTPRKFTTRLAAPTELTSGPVASLTPTLTWTSPGAAAWVVQIRTGSASTAAEFAALPLLHTSGVLTAATYTVPGSLLLLDTDYTYTVTALDVAVGVPGCEVASDPAQLQPKVAGMRVAITGYAAACQRYGTPGRYYNDTAVLTGQINGTFWVPKTAADQYRLNIATIERTTYPDTIQACGATPEETDTHTVRLEIDTNYGGPDRYVTFIYVLGDVGLANGGPTTVVGLPAVLNLTNGMVATVEVIAL
jgi:hypothetical protein